MSPYRAGKQSKGLDCCLWSSQAPFSVIFLLAETWHIFLGDTALVFFLVLPTVTDVWMFLCFPPSHPLNLEVFASVNIWQLFPAFFCKYRCITLLSPGKMWGFTCGQKELWRLHSAFLSWKVFCSYIIVYLCDFVAWLVAYSQDTFHIGKGLHKTEVLWGT